MIDFFKWSNYSLRVHLIMVWNPWGQKIPQGPWFSGFPGRKIGTNSWGRVIFSNSAKIISGGETGNFFYKRRFWPVFLPLKYIAIHGSSKSLRKEFSFSWGCIIKTTPLYKMGWNLNHPLLNTQSHVVPCGPMWAPQLHCTSLPSTLQVLSFTKNWQRTKLPV